MFLCTVGGGGWGTSGHLYRGGNFARKCISTTPIGASIYICSPAAIPPGPPLLVYIFVQLCTKLGFFYSDL